MTPRIDTVKRAIRVMLVDDHPVLRAGLSNLLALEPDISVVAQAGSGEAAIALCAELVPDICLLDLSMPGIKGIDALNHLLREVPNCRVIVLTSTENAVVATRSLAAGAAGFLTKTVAYAEIVEAIRAVHAGSTGIRKGISLEAAEPAAGSPLSPRESEVLQLLRRGLSNPDIGRAIGVTERTVKWHVHAILEKLGARDRTEAVARAFELGLFSLDSSYGR